MNKSSQSKSHRFLLNCNYGVVSTNTISTPAMVKYTLSTLLIIWQVLEVDFLQVPPNVFKDCLIYDDTFWIVYQTHFLLTDYLTLHILETEDHKFELRQFTQNILKRVNKYGYFLSVRITKSSLNKRNKSYHFPSTAYAPSQNLAKLSDDQEFYKAKRLSTDSKHGFALIVWDLTTLHLFLDQDYRTIVPEGRGTYAIQVVSKQCDVKNEIAFTLQRLWTEYQVINVVAQTPCSCDKTHIFIYHPFVKREGFWGLATSHTLDQIKGDSRLISNTLSDFNGFPLRISIFPRTPTAMQTLPKLLHYNPIYRNLTWSKGFAGLDGLVLATLAEYFNFEVVLVGSLLEDDFGKVLPNGTTVGSLADITERRAVYNANERLVAYFNLDQIDFTVPYTREDICLVVPKAAKIPKWKILFQSLDPQSWCFTLFAYVSCFMFWYNIGPSRSLPKVSWQMFSFFLGIPTKSFARKLDQVLFLIPCMIFSVVMLGVVQGSFFTKLTLFSFYQDVNTLEEMADLELPIGAFIWNLIRDDSDVIRRLKSKSVKPPDNIFDMIAAHRNIATIETRARAQLLIGSKYVDDDGFPLLHIVNECLTTFLNANIVPKGSALLTVFNAVLGKLFESGLTRKWNNDVVDSLIAEKMISVNRKRVRTKSFSLYDAQGAFFVILVGYACSVFVFLCEIVLKR
nr:PREDICTED: uncharacterized protein LOC103313533 [Tribolium castaneum]|eukprot:XP_015836758.1 PREDICTED: uncharacterized protein LOC103313533 [Tribolium castaneum]